MFNINLRDTTYRIVFKHDRNLNFTICHLITNKVIVDAAIARCSKKDHFNKNEGRKVALSRLVNDPELSFTREERKAIWEAYAATRHGKVD